LIATGWTVYIDEEESPVSPRSDSYETIVDAAEAIVLEAGASHMTLDAVAKKAGVSKGGLFYHFPTKDALLEAMINRTVRAREESRRKILSGLADSPSRELKAYILTRSIRDQKLDRMGIPLLAALAHNPKLAEPLRKLVRRQYEKIVPPGAGFERAAVLALAADALALQELLSVSPFTEEQRSRIVDELLKLADESAL
jgi:AcrR family transcriptional regulator